MAKYINTDLLEVVAFTDRQGSFSDGVQWLLEYIDALPSADVQSVQRWIPVSERLPEDGAWCLFTDGESMSVERYKADALDHFFPSGRWFDLNDAVAWMPLPEPYKD